MIQKLIDKILLFAFRSKRLAYWAIAWELRGLAPERKRQVIQRGRAAVLGTESARD